MSEFSNIPVLSPQSMIALEILGAGGTFIDCLYRSKRTGKIYFHRRLLSEPRSLDSIVEGIGQAEFYELSQADMLIYAGYTANSREVYELKTDVANSVHRPG